MSANFIDKAVAYIAPTAALKRADARWRLQEAQEAQRMYDAATKGRRTDGWHALGTSANAEIGMSIDMLRNRSREMVRNNVWATRAVQAIANNTVGTGIMPAYETAGKAKQGKKWFHEAWQAWAETTACDWDDLHDLYGLQKLIMRTVTESGECVVRKRRVNAGLRNNPIKLQVCEGDIIDTAKDGMSTERGGFIVQGVEFDAQGRRIGYWLFDQHPGEAISIPKNIISKFVPKEEVLHVFEVLRPGQVRGVPFAYSAMIRMHDFGDYEDAQLLRQKIAACYTVFITDTSEQVLAGNKKAIARDERIEPGLIKRLRTGEDVKFATPPGTPDYSSFSLNALRGVAAAFGLTYEALTGDLSGVNFSSGRMGWIEMSRNVHNWQYNIMIPMFCSRMFEWFMQGATVAGQLSAAGGRCTWTPPRREMIDPVKETDAKLSAIGGGLMSWSETVRQDGYDPDELFEQIKKDRERFKAAGMEYPNNKPASARPGADKEEEKDAEKPPQGT